MGSSRRMRQGFVVGTVASVLGGLILYAILRSDDLFTQVGSWAWSGVSWIWTTLQSSHSVPAWAILVVGLLALLGLAIVLLVIGALIMNRSKGSNENPPPFRRYTEDVLDGLRWRWRWIGNRIDDLWCYCLVCDAQLVYREDILDGMDLICENCPADGSLLSRIGSQSKRGRVVATMEGDKNYLVASAAREITRRIRTGIRPVS